MTDTKTVYLVGGGKGGVGKSLATMALLDHLLRTGQTPHLIETDTSNPDVAKSYQDSVSTELIDLDIEDGWLELLNRCAELEDRALVISTGSRNNGSLKKFGDLLAGGLETLKAQLVTYWMIDGNRDCLELLREYRQIFPQSRVHVVRNSHCARAFDVYESSKLRHEIETHGGHSLTFPSLAERVTHALNKFRLTLAEAAASEKMPFGHRTALAKWQREVGQMFEQVAA